MTTRNTRLFGAFGFLSLCATLALITTHRAPATTSGPVPVTVTNTPLATADINLAGGAQPFEQQTTTSIANGSADGFTSLTVPAGQRLVVEAVSVYRTGSGLTTQSVQAFIGVHDSNNADFALPVVAPSSANSPGATLAFRMYFNPGSTIDLGIHRNGTSGAETDSISISGYLVPAS